MKRGRGHKTKKPSKKRAKHSLANPHPRPLKIPEVKNFEAGGTIATTFNASTFAAPSLLNGLQYGTAANQHVGRKVMLRSILIRMTSNLGPTSTQGANTRVLVIYDRQTNGAAPAALDITTANDFWSVMNLNNSDRFVVIFDKILPAISQNGNWSVAKKVYKKLSLDMIFNAGSTGTVTDIQTGSLYLLVGINGTMGVANGGFTFTSRIRFVDS